MRILINAAVMIFSCKIKIKNNETLTETFIEILNKIFDENHMISDDFSNEIVVD